MANKIDQEVDAIRTLLTALEPLDPRATVSVLDYVIRRLGIDIKTGAGHGEPEDDTHPPPPPGEPPPPESEQKGEIHIRDLKEEKQPRSANEMAALVAYYVSHSAPKGERKKTVTTKDIETYFKISDFRLPTKPQFTLPNAKAAGYLDAVGSGEYKLNPVGYNLVVHSLPKTEKKPSPRRRTKAARRRVKKSAKKKVTKKKS